MQEQSRYSVGIDIGTTTVRCVVGHVDSATGAPKIIGVGQAANTGMRKGTVSHLNGPAAAIDAALGEAERMSGHQVEVATLSVNGSHILSTKSDGMIAVSSQNQEVTVDDVARLEEVATIGKVPANREILEIVPHAYRLDGQDNIKDPVGMTGTRLEIHANIVSGLLPHIANVQKAAEMAKVDSRNVVPAVLASAQAVLTESQIENGVAVIDLGGSTTGVAVFEEGDLQYVGVVPVGGINVTNDLAIGLKVDPEVAEVVKLEHARLDRDGASEQVEVKHGDQTLVFDRTDVDEIVEARYEEIFEAVARELKRAGRAGKLPSGVVLVGGGANIRGIVEFAKEQLGVAARISKPTGYAGVSEQAERPEYAAVIGLMLMDEVGGPSPVSASRSKVSDRSSGVMKKAGGLLSGLMDKFR
ncbi:cell division protein FtsA [Candidatus Saccharibacteria bacterium 32-50-10]|nr:MAG: cell division protein FtsA [Candidatus Saccharibacteria bacterium 32-50-10]